MAARQLPSRRTAGPRGPHRPAARLLPPAPQAEQRSAGGLPPRVRRGLGVRRPHRQPVRSGGADPFRARLPDRPAAQHRRAVGRGDHAAHRAGREPAALGRAHHEPPLGARGGGQRGRSPDGRERPRRRPDGAHALPAASLLRGLLRSARPAPARPGSGDDACRGLAAGAAEARGHDGRRDGAPRASAPGRDQRHGAQHHHQHAPDLRCRLGEAVRGGESGRRCAACRQRLRRHGFRHPQPLPHRDRADRPRHRACGSGDRAAAPSRPPRRRPT